MTGTLIEVEGRPGVWRAWIDLPRLEDGKRRRKCITIYATGKRDAQSQHAKLVAAALAGDILAPTKETVESYLGRWLEKRKADGLSPKTLETWRDFTRAYIAPHVGRVVLEKLAPKHVEELYTKLLVSGRRQGEGGLAPRTVLHVHRLLSEAMKSAVRLQLIPRNPCDGLGPKVGAHVEREGVKQYDEPTIRRLLDAAAGTWLEVPVLLAAGLGMRRGECLGLQWSAVNFKLGTLTIRQSVQSLRGQGTFEKSPKSGKPRELALPEFLAEALRKHKGAQAAHRLQLGDAWTDRGFVNTDGMGNPRSPGSLTFAFTQLIEREDLPPITFHDLRHLNATLLLLEGVDVKIVSARLGHCNTTITRDLYQHVLKPMDDDAARKTDAFFRRAMGG